ncbi:metallophosphoesterase [Tundrisphaera lichenicola]|uniref:metallophosphoesterase n=1 Tax=Tundrisphaera lichenicola TaxID=2029860 RepID=UPI003EB997E7
MSLRRLRLVLRSLLACVALTALSYVVWDWATTVPMDPNARRVGPFLATPYLQLGEKPEADDLTLIWHADDVDADWSVEVRSPLEGDWKPSGAPDARSVILDGVERHRIYRSVLGGLAPGERFAYRVKLGDSTAFEAEARAKVPPGQPHRFVAFGDSAKGTEGQCKIAYQTHLLRPDYVMITGDLVYFRGKVGEYRARFFPYFAAAEASPGAGAPLLSSTLFVGAPGNHDLVTNDFAEDPDLMAYFYFWSQPLNGPTRATGSRLAPPLEGPEDRLRAFREIAGPNYPRMANFSFDYGDVHWTVLDSNPYVQWADPALRAWLAFDLASAKDKPWKFVTFHHPGFNSSTDHQREQQMRILADVFELGGVSIVFSGHVHNYQRTYPLRFAARTYADGHAPEPGRPVAGTWTIDKAYDGTARTRPMGVIYLVTGAGGANLYNAEQSGDRSSWLPFTEEFISDRHSLTVVDVEPNAATVRQVDADGIELDRFIIAR